MAEEGLVRKGSGSSAPVPPASRLESFLSGELPTNDTGATVTPIDANEENHLEMALLSLRDEPREVGSVGESSTSVIDGVEGGDDAEHSPNQTEQAATQSALTSSQTAAPLDSPSAISQRAATST